MMSYCSVSPCSSSTEWAVIRRWLRVITVHCLPLLLPLVIHLNPLRATQATHCLICTNSVSFSIPGPFVTEVRCMHCTLLCRGGISPQPFPDHFLCLHIHISWDKPSLLPRQTGLQLLFSDLLTYPGLHTSHGQLQCPSHSSSHHQTVQNVAQNTALMFPLPLAPFILNFLEKVSLMTYILLKE